MLRTGFGIASRLTAVTLLGMLVCPAMAQDPVKLRVGTLAPKGSTYHRALQEMGEKWRAAQGPGSSFTVYTDGTQGGEADMVRRMRVGQLNAVLMSVVGLMEIDRGVAALQYMPMVFSDWGEVDGARDKLRPALEKRLLDKGFVVLFWADAGWVRFFSREKALSPEDFKRTKMFVWSGNTEQVDLMKQLGYQPVSLETADILPGLQTGLINAVPAGAYFALVGQFDSVARHMLDMKWVPLVGAAVITRKTWDALSVAGREQLTNAARVAGQRIRERSRQEDQEAIEAMRKRGLIVHPLTPELETQWQRSAAQAYPWIRSSIVPAELFDQARAAVQEHRASAGGARK